MKPRRARKPDRLPPYGYDARKRLLARVHIMAQELKLSDDSYRDVLERIAGTRTAATLEDTKLYDVIKELERLGAGKKTAGRPVADSPMALRARAIWMSLFNLDEIDNASEHALAAFVKRQTGKEDMRFCNAQELSDVIDGLKSMAERAGFDATIKPREGGILAPKRALVQLQWKRLHAAGWAQVEGDWGMLGFARRCGITPNDRPLKEFEGEHLDQLASKLGYRIRELKLGVRRQTQP